MKAACCCSLVRGRNAKCWEVSIVEDELDMDLVFGYFEKQKPSC